MLITALILLSVITGLLLYLAFFKKADNVSSSKLDEVLKEQEKSEKRLKDEITTNRGELRESLKDFKGDIGKDLDKVNTTVETKLKFLQEDNSTKLEKMRETVAEKLDATLEKRFDQSFKLVSDRLDQVHKGLGEMQMIAVGVGDLKKVLSNVKTRGTWGEAQLGNLIEEIFTPDQYEKNVRIKKNSRDNVEYAIKFPGTEEGQKVLLPIDAKFPLEDYEKLIKAQESGDLELIKELQKALESRVKSEAKDIRDKYIDVPNTTDFGILFLPTESLYAEILRIPGLFESLRRDFKVVLTGPTTIQAILNSFKVGFTTLKIQKSSSEVWTVLSSVKNEFGKFGDLLEKTHKKIQETGSVMEAAITKTRTIEKKLDKVQTPVGIQEKVITEDVLETPKELF